MASSTASPRLSVAPAGAALGRSGPRVTTGPATRDTVSAAHLHPIASMFRSSVGAEVGYVPDAADDQSGDSEGTRPSELSGASCRPPDDRPDRRGRPSSP